MPHLNWDWDESTILYNSVWFFMRCSKKLFKMLLVCLNQYSPVEILFLNELIGDSLS